MSKVFSIIFILSLGAAGFAQKPAPAKKTVGKSTQASSKKTPAKKTPAKGPQASSKTAPAKKATARSTAASSSTVSAKKAAPRPTPVSTPDPEPDRTRFDAAVAASPNAEKARLLRLFIDEFPASELRPEAFAYLITSRAVIGDEKIKAGEVEQGVESFKLAIEEAPIPTPDRLFEDVIVKIPLNLFYSAHRGPAIDVAAAMEKKYADNAKRLLSVAGFYLSIENGAEAKRVVESAIALEPASVQAYQALGLAHRLNFDLEESEKAYAKAIELDPASVSAKRSLAEMKRATGKADEAVAIYREIISSNANDVAARNGLILSLFDSGKRSEAETELDASVAKTPRNFTLLAGVGYWYAANNVGDKAVEYAQQAVDAEPRYIWGHIALARGLMKLNRPIDAERVLIKAKQFGNFPTLEYEIASARFKAGLYREAVEELQKSFTLRDGLIETKLGGRLLKSERTFQELLAHERRASIMEPTAADDDPTSARLRILFELTGKLSASPEDAEIAALTDEFVKGDDKMKLHRQLHAADILLQKNTAIAKASELVKAAVGNTDAGLEVSAPGAAVMASELYESRTVAFARNEIILIPEVPRQTLSAILRGRIEELAGWSFYQQKNYPAAVVRLRRAISVMPDKSAWWRSSMWRLGAALEADGKDKEALDSYIQSYITDRPSPLRYGVIESLYRRVNGGTDGLEEKIGPNPLPTVAAVTPVVSQPEKAAPNTESVSKTRTTLAEPRKSAERTVTKKPVIDQPKVETPQPQTVDTAKKDKMTEKTEPETVVEKEPEKNAPVEPKSEPMVKTETASQAAEKKDENPARTGTEPSVPGQQGSLLEVKSVLPDTVKAENLPAKLETETLAETRKTEQTKIEEKAEDKQATMVKLPEQTPPAVTESKSVSEPPTTAIQKSVSEDTSTLAPSTAKSDLGEDKKAESVQPTNILRDPFPETSAETKPPAPERKPLIILNDPVKTDNAPKTRDLFEPVIITVPRNSSQKTTNPKPEDGTKPEADGAKKTDESVTSGATRRRVIEGKEIRSDQACSIEVDQENISLLNGGGSLGVLVSVAGDGKTSDVTASSNSPRDIEVRAQPEIAGLSERRFYVVKSVSSNTGVFLVNFESPCGKKEVTVRVR